MSKQNGKSSISFIKNTTEQISNLVNMTTSKEDFNKNKDALLFEIQNLKYFSENFTKNYLKKIDAIDKPSFLQSLNTNAQTIIDVGVHTGTPSLYKAFRSLPFVLVDPVKEGESLLIDKPTEYTYINKAVGNKKEKLILRENEGKNSLLQGKGVFNTWEPVDKYEVDVDRLDKIITDLGATPPYGIKLDVQGFELRAVQGMTNILPETDFLICETNIRNTSEGSYQFSDLVAELLKHDFVFFNILNNFKPYARFYDVVFLPRNSKKFDEIA